MLLCVILYSSPAGVFPFCTYNCGPEYRSIVERGFAEGKEYASKKESNETKTTDAVSENC